MENIMFEPGMDGWVNERSDESGDGKGDESQYDWLVQRSEE